ncbi:MAG: NapC/NirT family cytochrome c [SAR324 cluster bacterium]|nr:NapC/NirT family cytochrome c [SAR324 cluster bacterium]
MDENKNTPDTPDSKSNPGEPNPAEWRKIAPPRAIYNLWSLIGFFLALIGVMGELFFFVIELFSTETPSYQGIVYVIFLIAVVFGLLLFVVGYRREKKRRQSGKPPSFSGDILARYPVLSLMISMVLVAAVTLVFGIGSHTVYEVTESNSFCGETCHSVMHPEWTTYHSSSHARVDCVECHIGSGAGWYVKSKLSGLRQIYAVSAGIFPKPIPTPIHDLRPARETCEECHWPQKFIGFKESVRSYFLSDEENTPFKIRMLMKIGGEKSTFMKGSGIHYHMLLASKIEYIARDEERQEIAWVRVKRDDGSITEYNHVDDPLDEEAKKTMQVRTMDCMDCHNRPAHNFLAPMESVNNAMEQGAIPMDVPSIKLEAVKALDTDYESTPEAMIGIANSLRTFYEENHPELIEESPDKWKQTVSAVQDLYKNTIFPEMKAKWSAYPDNIGHRDWPGCFRCHTDQLASEDDESIFTTCNKCHLILAQGQEIEEVNVNFVEGLPFLHPGEEDPFEEFTDCSDCHTGGAEVYE